MGKSPKIFTNRSSQAGGVDSFCFLKTSLRALWFDRMIDTNSQWRSLSRIRFQKTVLKIPSQIYVVFIAILTYHLIKRYKMSSCCLIYKGRYPLKKAEFYEKNLQNGGPPPPYCFYEILIQRFDRISGTYSFLNKRYEIRLWFFLKGGFPYSYSVLL